MSAENNNIIILCHIPKDTPHATEINTLTEKEKTFSFLIGVNAILTMKHSKLYQETTDEQLKDLYESKLKEKELELSITNKIYHEEKEKLRQEITQQYQEKQDEFNRIFHLSNELKQQIVSLEKELIIKNETFNHTVQNHKNTIELEINNRIQEQEKKYNALMNTNTLLEQELKTNKTMIEFEITSKLNHQLQTAQQRITELIIQSSNSSKEEHEKIHKLQHELTQLKDQHTLLLNEKNTKDIETLTKKVGEIEQNSKSGIRGSSGEKSFYDLAVDTFRSYEGFDIITKAKTTGHSGDHILHFKNYSILTDTKNFQESSGVSTTDINKLKRDMKENQQIKFAWLISLYKPILKHCHHPFVIEIDQETGVCYCYINNLLLDNNPKQLLELVWYNCELIYNYVLNKESDIDLLGKYKRQEEKNRVSLEQLLKQSKERKMILKQLEDNFLETEKNITDMLKRQLLDIRNNHAIIIEEWWANNLVKCMGNFKLQSKAIYDKFISTNPENTNSITEDMFKNLIKSFLEPAAVICGKSEKTQYKIMNYKWKV